MFVKNTFKSLSLTCMTFEKSLSFFKSFPQGPEVMKSNGRNAPCDIWLRTFLR